MQLGQRGPRFGHPKKILRLTGDVVAMVALGGTVDIAELFPANGAAGPRRAGLSPESCSSRYGDLSFLGEWFTILASF